MAIKRKELKDIEEKTCFPWKNVAHCDNFSDADKKRTKLLSENDKIQVKVKRCGFNGTKYVIKLRKNPIFEEKVERKGKKSRKKGKNKRNNA